MIAHPFPLRETIDLSQIYIPYDVKIKKKKNCYPPKKSLEINSFQAVYIIFSCSLFSRPGEDIVHG